MKTRKRLYQNKKGKNLKDYMCGVSFFIGLYLVKIEPCVSKFKVKIYFTKIIKRYIQENKDEEFKLSFIPHEDGLLKTQYGFNEVDEAEEYTKRYLNK